MHFEYNTKTGDMKFDHFPMSQERFETLCWMIGGGSFMFFVYMLLTSTVR